MTAELWTYLCLAISAAAVVRLVIEARREYLKAQVLREVRLAKLMAMTRRRSV